MKAIKKFFLTISTAVTVLCLVSSGAFAATLNVVSGQLMGATGVTVGGGVYDVRFVDGTCAVAYSGCDDISDFTFQSAADALLAAQALLEQVLIDGPDGLFDYYPTRVNGVTQTPGNVYTAFGFPTPRYPDDPTHFLDVSVSLAHNAFGANTDQAVISSNPLYAADDLSDHNTAVYAVWGPQVSAVPLPAALPLYGAGMALMGFIGWRKKRVATA
ncbi:hypothetical protein A9Q83_00735 [Alphaproteobacteria bacterium 46_93_T64]|nr:hypothetical protein A9Q83_00735 [Alphaproteobacteria bacterium 46_93_T64]